jgi:hypothetical protein
MERLTYKQAYDKIIDAYFKDEIEPYDAKFCFCGTLCDNSVGWMGNSLTGIHNNFGSYSGVDYGKMESALFSKIDRTGRHMPDYEDALFSGMVAALDVLKEIHRSRGEDVDSLPALSG